MPSVWSGQLIMVALGFGWKDCQGDQCRCKDKLSHKLLLWSEKPIAIESVKRGQCVIFLDFADVKRAQHRHRRIHHDLYSLAGRADDNPLIDFWHHTVTTGGLVP